MKGLVDIEPTSTDLFSSEDDGGLRLGKLYFDELIGTQIQSITTTIAGIDHAALQRAGIQSGESHHQVPRDIQRRTWLRVYPDPNSAQIVYDYQTQTGVDYNSDLSHAEHWLTGEQIRALKKAQNSFTKIVGFLR